MEKRCPTCNRKYIEEEINYCLADGSFLLTLDELAPTEAPPTVKIVDAPTEVLPGRQSNIPTEIMPGVPPATAPAYARATISTRPFISMALIIGFLGICALLIIGVIFVVGRSDSSSSANANYFTGNNTSSNKGVVSTYATPRPTSTPTASPSPSPASDSSLRKITGMADLSGDYKYDRLIGINSTTPFNSDDYTSRREGDDFTVVIKNATVQGKPSLPGGGAIDGAELQQRGSDVVLLVKAKAGTKNWVWRNASVLLVQIGLKK